MPSSPRGSYRMTSFYFILIIITINSMDKQLARYPIVLIKRRQRQHYQPRLSSIAIRWVCEPLHTWLRLGLIPNSPTRIANKSHSIWPISYLVIIIIHLPWDISFHERVNDRISTHALHLKLLQRRRIVCNFTSMKKWISINLSWSKECRGIFSLVKNL